MPDLKRTLQGNDLSFLKMVADAWGIEINAPDAYTALPQLANAMNNRSLVIEIVDSLPTEARLALEELMNHEAHLPWSLFQRRFGDVRSMGAGRRDRERPDLNPASPAEILWYRALVGRVFMHIDTEPQEYAYIPDEISTYLAFLIRESTFSSGRPATPVECAYPILADDVILDDACTLLAALRINQVSKVQSHLRLNIPIRVLRALLDCAGLLDEAGIPLPENTRTFLEASRGSSLAYLGKAWMNSSTFNDLRLIQGLVFEGEWQNDSLVTRQSVLDMLHSLPQDSWWNLNSFIQAVHDSNPDFQRPAGDYDSWFIRKETPGDRVKQPEYLRGFSSWFEVEGAYLRFVICGLMHWLGLVDLARSEQNSSTTAFRPSAWMRALWQGIELSGFPVEDGCFTLTTDGFLSVPGSVPRSVRYQIARFSQWEEASRGKENEFEYRYRLTPAALELARKSGLRTQHLLRLFQRHAHAVPPTLVQSLERWEQQGVQAQFESCVILRLTSPDILDSLRRTRAARYLGESLSPTIVQIKPGGEVAVENALAEIGYLAGKVGKGSA